MADSSACTVSGVETSYILSEGDPSITPVIKNADETLVLGTDYTATLDGAAVAAFPITFTEGVFRCLSLHLDRLVHKSKRFLLKGESLRKKY